MATTTTPSSSPTTQTPTAPARATAEEGSVRTVRPRVDIYETERSYVLLADMPGVGPQGLEVVAERNTLVISGHVEPPATRPDYQEFELADYRRSFVLGDDLDTDGTAATLRDGVLRVEIPKSADAQPKKIPVRTE
jgi:HSP20 family molecular chaperone IbpA